MIFSCTSYQKVWFRVRLSRKSQQKTSAGSFGCNLKLFAFANAWQVSTLDELDHGCGLRSDSARAIDAHRAGPNGHPGDADDRLFHSEQDLLGVHMVGPVTLDQLEDCALDWGF